MESAPADYQSHRQYQIFFWQLPITQLFHPKYRALSTVAFGARTFPRRVLRVAFLHSGTAAHHFVPTPPLTTPSQRRRSSRSFPVLHHTLDREPAHLNRPLLKRNRSSCACACFSLRLSAGSGREPTPRRQGWGSIPLGLGCSQRSSDQVSRTHPAHRFAPESAGTKMYREATLAGLLDAAEESDLHQSFSSQVPRSLVAPCCESQAA